ncbi:hypothetical protein ColKHC_03890 [Colletotrichum higginsianum]|nr:hypothetical protein ColKHC_03890 [Colletotrichum higginsianum]
MVPIIDNAKVDGARPSQFTTGSPVLFSTGIPAASLTIRPSSSLTYGPSSPAAAPSPPSLANAATKKPMTPCPSPLYVRMHASATAASPPAASGSPRTGHSRIPRTCFSLARTLHPRALATVDASALTTTPSFSSAWMEQVE